jgi:uncharacterized Zn finger protein
MVRSAIEAVSPFRSLLDRAALRRHAGPRSFERGEAYFAGGELRSLAEHKGTVSAKVLGTRPYRVKLRADGGELQYSCTCPVGQDGAFRRHCVAAGLAWLDEGRAGEAGGKRGAKPSVTMDDVREWLAGQGNRALVEMIMDQAMDDERLRQRPLLKAAKTRPKGIDLDAYRRAIDEAVDPGGFVDCHGAYEFASSIGDAVDSLEELLREGHALEVVELAEHALEAVEEALGSADDSDGYMGGILERLQEIHLKACKKARPDPEGLARRLFSWELRSDWGSFSGASETYAGVLGEKELDTYRKLAEAEWAKVPALGPGREDAQKYGRRFRLAQIIEALARRNGDVEAIVEINKRDLSSAYGYLQIAERYKKARKRDLALEWAERGVRAFPQRTDSRLREFLADEYHRRKRHDDAMVLIWAEFVESPGLERYRALESHVHKSGRWNWNTWRAKALGFLRKTSANAKRKTRSDPWNWSRWSNRTQLLRILLRENDVEAAWQEASEGGCSEALWMELAAKRERNHPEDAMPIYQRRVESTLNRNRNDAYRDAVALLKKVQGAMTRLGRNAEFVTTASLCRGGCLADSPSTPSEHALGILSNPWEFFGRVGESHG